MAIYHLNARGVSPARGSSAVASAAYQSGDALRDDLTGELKRYSRSERVADTGLVLPEGSPEWGRQRLWNEAARAHAGGTELVAKRYVIALPRELSLDEQRACVADFCGLFPDHARDWAIHGIDGDNPHAHVLVSALPLGPSGFERQAARKSTKVYLCRDARGRDVMVAAGDWKAAKAAGVEKVYNFNDGSRRTMSQAAAAGLSKADRKSKQPVSVHTGLDGAPAFDAEKAELARVRSAWAGIANARLAEHAERSGERAASIDCRSFADRGVERVAQRHEGPQVRAIERKAERAAASRGAEYSPVTDRARENALAREANAEISRIERTIARLRRQVADMLERAAGLRGLRSAIGGVAERAGAALRRAVSHAAERPAQRHQEPSKATEGSVAAPSEPEHTRQSRGRRAAPWLLDLACEVASAAKQAKDRDPGARFFVADCPFDEFRGGDVEALLEGEGALDGVAMPGLRTFKVEPAEDGRTRIVVPAEDAADARSTASGMNMVYRVATGEGKDLFDCLDGLDDPHAEASLEVPGETPEQRERFSARIAAGIGAELLVSAPDAFVGYDEETASIQIGFPLSSSSQVEETLAAVAKAEEANPSEKQGGSEPLRYLDTFLPIDSIKGDGPRVAEGLPKPRQGNGGHYIVELPPETFVGGRDLGGCTFAVPERLVTACPDGMARLRVSESSTFTARLAGTDQAARVTAPELWGAFAERALVADKPVYGKISTLRHVVGDGGRRGRDGAGLPAPKAGEHGPYYDVMIPADEARAVLPGEEIPDGAHLSFSVRADNVDPQGLIALKTSDRVSIRLSERAPGGLFKTTRLIAADAAPLMSAMESYVDEHPRDPKPVLSGPGRRAQVPAKRRPERARSAALEDGPRARRR